MLPRGVADDGLGRRIYLAVLAITAVVDADVDASVIDARAVLLGVLAQWLHVVALYVATPLEGSQIGSVLLVLATGLVGGLVAGDLAGPPAARSGIHGLTAGLVGGVGTGVVFWWATVTPGAPRGAFWSLAYLVATAPIPAVRTHGDLVVAALAVGLALAIASLAWIAGVRAPDRAQSMLE